MKKCEHACCVDVVRIGRTKNFYCFWRMKMRKKAKKNFIRYIFSSFSTFRLPSLIFFYLSMITQLAYRIVRPTLNSKTLVRLLKYMSNEQIFNAPLYRQDPYFTPSPVVSIFFLSFLFPFRWNWNRYVFLVVFACVCGWATSSSSNS